MYIKIIGLLFLLLLVGCNTAYQREMNHNMAKIQAEAKADANYTVNAMANADNAYANGMSTLKSYQAEKTCDSPNSNIIKSDIDEIMNSLNEVTVKMGSHNPLYTRKIKLQHQNLSFEFADSALKKGCLDDANIVYRDIVNMYVGQAYGGIRDRARLGIDDVRAAKK